MKKLMFYCQHVLGMGHFVRSMELVRGLKDFAVTFFNGGEVIPGFPLPPSVEIVQMPPLESDENFKEIRSSDRTQGLDEIKDARVRCLLDGYQRLQPDILVIELFPFGRKQFAFELVPLLAHIRLSGKKTKVVCSLRDILVSRKDETRHEQRVCALLNRYFDAVLIHADPRMQRLDETFHSVDQLKTDIYYTGYVAEPAPARGESLPDDGISVEGGEPLILVSVGGGRVGAELLRASLEASAILMARQKRHRMAVFTGPYLPEEQFAELQRVAQRSPAVILKRYTAQFVALMARADLSVSMAGYNTCMNVVATGVPALVLPFTGGANNEQTLRARKLEALGIVGIIEAGEVAPERLAEKIAEWLDAKPAPAQLDLAGVANSAKFLAALSRRHGAALSKTGAAAGFATAADSLWKKLQSALEGLEKSGNLARIFVRDDDVDVDEGSLRRLLDIGFARGVALNLEVIPATLSDGGTRLLRDYKGFAPNLIELHQHGWQHVNHQARGKKCEFGSDRTFEQQLRDIARGKARLEELLEERLFPGFTPPWNRCTADTLKALDQLGFQVFSADRSGQPRHGRNFREISITLDLYRWKNGATMKPADEIVDRLIEQLASGDVVGLLLHHKVMDDAAFGFLDALLAQLSRSPSVRFNRFETILSQLN